MKMKRVELGKPLAMFLVFILSFTGLFTPVAFQNVSASEKQGLVITEIMPNNKGADDYEYFEIHNNSGQPLNLADYKYFYTYSDGSGSNIPLSVGEHTIDQGQTLVFWYNKSNKNKADFLTHYGASIDAESILEFSGAGFTGFYNGGNRSIVLQDNTGNAISSAAYLPDDIGDGLSAHFKLPSSGHDMETFLKKSEPTVGKVDPLQLVPTEQPADKEAPVITHEPVTAGSSANDLTVTAKVTDNNKVDSATLFYKQEEEGTYLQATMALSAEEQIYKAVIPKNELWSETFSYYIEATDGINTSKTETYTAAIEQPPYDTQKVPPLLVTEIVPDSTNVGKLDGYEFIEIYNNSDKPVNFKDYKIQYRYPAEGPEADLVWPSDKEDVVIPSKKSLVFWIINADNGSKTVADFNKHYGSQLTENENIVRIHSGGMANGSHRGIVIATNTGKETSRAFYNDQPNVNDSAANKGILYRFPTSEGTIDSTKISSAKEQATPGKVAGIQIPKAPVDSAADSEHPTLQLIAPTQAVKEENNLKISFDAKDNQAVKTLAFYYRSNAEADYKKIYLRENYDDGLYHHTVYSPELIGKDWVEYYAMASDGANTVATEKQKVTITREVSTTGLRLNVKDHDLLSGEKTIKATDDSEQPKLLIDNKEINHTFKSMENKAYFAFDVKKTNLYFKNGVTMGNETLKIFDDTINSYETMSVPISPDKMQINEDTVITVRSGTKVSPFDPVSEENRDDFYIKNIRLVLSDGTTIYDPDFKDVDKELPIGDSAGSHVFLDFRFNIPSDKFNSVAYKWNTKLEKEGEHEIKARNSEGKETKANVRVDNTAPEIETSVLEGQEYKGDFDINATINDAISSVESFEATLDGKKIELPFKTSSADLTAGNHVFTVTAIDKAGNKGEKKVTFSVVEEMPRQPEVITPKDGETNVNPNPKLSVRVTDPTNDNMDVSFYQGFKYNSENKANMIVSQHASDTEPPKVMKLDGEKELSETELEAIEKLDGTYTTTSSTEQFPYQRFEIKLDAAVKDSDQIELKWNGKSLPGRKVTMYAWNHAEGKWIAVDSKVAAKEDFQLKGTVSGPAFVKDRAVQVIVQDK
ncbi:lamin tail domain-containing protein [Bacillus sp. V59.32b]|nr:lamin tail domain-containing protein [Bacillus sp. V59.32b]